MSAALSALHDAIKHNAMPYKNLIPSFTSILKQVGGLQRGACSLLSFALPVCQSASLVSCTFVMVPLRRESLTVFAMPAGIVA